ncbi:MAG: type II secretion system protein [Desulfobacterales bacterium]|nr:MAG: type II secretion system protein [Desulfobacterales bacterium]
MSKCIRNWNGVTLIELIAAMAIISILATGILPLSVITYKRTKEIELRQNLRIIRKAIDEYKRLVDEEKIQKDALDSGYPKDLNVLVQGVNLKGPIPKKVKFLRRIPKDPMTEDGEWGLRSYTDEPNSEIWGGQDVYDVFSTSEKEALDGTYYKDW